MTVREVPRERRPDVTGHAVEDAAGPVPEEQTRRGSDRHERQRPERGQQRRFARARTSILLVAALNQHGGHEGHQGKILILDFLCVLCVLCGESTSRPSYPPRNGASAAADPRGWYRHACSR